MNIDLSQLFLLSKLGQTGFNLSRASDALGLSQPSASRKLKELELQVGAPLVVRNGRRITGLTPLGESLIAPVRDVSISLSHLRSLVNAHHGKHSNELTIATTHSQARYFLPAVIARFRERYPEIRIRLSQSMPAEIANKVAEGDVELGICTDRIAQHPDLDFIPGYRWSHAICAPAGHPLLKGVLDVSRLGEYPVLTYVPAITGRALLEGFLRAQNINLDIVLEAADTDVLKTFVRLGLGYGLIASMGFEADVDHDLVLRPISGAPVLTMGVARRRNAYLSAPARAMLSIIKQESVIFEKRIAP